MAQLVILAGGVLLAGTGLIQLLRGKAMKKRDGSAMSMGATRVISIISFSLGVAGLIYGFSI